MATTMHQTKVITSEDQVPPGYISMVEVRARFGETVSKKLSDAHKQGLLPAVKLMRTIDDRTGPVWVERKAWDSWKAARDPHPAAEQKPKFHGTRDKNESPWDELVSMSFALHSMNDTLARIEEALEGLLNVQTRMLDSMQRLEATWAANDKGALASPP